ncbi:MAG: acyltransferase [Nitriliruptor sp.]|nr:MAG: acyltransferase [Nitriliruptor sp.]
MSLAQRVEEQTPATRDRYLDLLRVASILLVVLGHWMVRVFTADDGEVTEGYLLEAVPVTQWATLLFNVMPIFFLVGGALNAPSWRRAREEGEHAADWLRRRSRRLLRPLLPLLALWLTIAMVLGATVGEDAMILDPDSALTPIWFLAAYLLVTALTPVTLRLHEWAGGLWLIAACAVVAVGVDVLRFGPLADWVTIEGQPAVGAVNYLTVYVLLHQLGYLWADDRLPDRPWQQLALGLGGAAALVVMVGPGPYPLTMVPIAGTDLPNNLNPPSAALVALGLCQLAVALLAHDRVTGWLQDRRVWTAVALPGGRLMTIFLWHQTAMLAVANATILTGVWPLTERVDGSWWATRPLWLLLCAAVLGVLVALVGRFESPPPPRPAGLAPRPAAALAGLGVTLSAGGVGWLVVAGVSDPAMPLRLPLPALVPLAVGLVALGVVGDRLTAAGGR